MKKTIFLYAFLRVPAATLRLLHIPNKTPVYYTATGHLNKGSVVYITSPDWKEPSFNASAFLEASSGLPVGGFPGDPPGAPSKGNNCSATSVS